MASSSSCDDEDEESIISHYFSRGYKYTAIIRFLDKHHGIKMSHRTLKNRLKKYKIKKKLPSYDLDIIRERVRHELTGPGCQRGYRSMWHMLRLQNIQVPRQVVADVMRELDPEGCRQRKARRLERRRYLSPGPNFTWHVDGYDKLKPYGFPIHGCIDGWSRRIMWLKVAKSNNNPDIIANFYLDCVSEVGGCPKMIRTDCGTENGVMAAMQCTFQNEVNAHKYGTSPANQRIESWWAFYRRSRSSWWMDFFKNLVENYIINTENELQMECLWFCFSQLIQEDLDNVQEQWNTHLIRRSTHGTISGRPNELYYLPELHGGEDDLLLPIPDNEVKSMRDNLTYEEEKSCYQEYFEYVQENTELQHPSNADEALELYQSLLETACKDN